MGLSQEDRPLDYGGLDQPVTGAQAEGFRVAVAGAVRYISRVTNSVSIQSWHA